MPELTMPLIPERLFNAQIPDRNVSITARDAILYALTCGAQDLGLVHEEGLKILPSFGQNLCFNDDWMDDAGVDLSMVMHGGLDLRFHKPLSLAENLTVKARIAGLVDKGEGKPALILHISNVEEAGEVVFTSRSNLFVLKAGGFGGSQGDAFEMIALPERAADLTAEITTMPQAPLFFRLLGDLNPLHVLPEAAAKLGFDRPILHGANTFGLMCQDLVTRLLGGEVAGLRRLTARFAGPAFPGETLAVSYWREGENDIYFNLRSVERDRLVLDGGYARIEG